MHHGMPAIRLAPVIVAVIGHGSRAKGIHPRSWLAGDTVTQAHCGCAICVSHGRQAPCSIISVSCSHASRPEARLKPARVIIGVDRSTACGILLGEQLAAGRIVIPAGDVPILAEIRVLIAVRVHGIQLTIFVIVIAHGIRGAAPLRRHLTC